MSMIKVENLTFSYPSSYDNIFENVSFQIDSDWKLGFIGRNGRGKTTFLNLLMGKYEYNGHIISSVKFDYFPYPVSDINRTAAEIISDICPSAEDWEIMRELSYLDVSLDVLYRPFETLSNGERTKALLAALFLREGNFLLIDEPTNHLDTNAREVTAKYLKKKKGFILVSHDRHFLDSCVDHILSINKTNIEVQSGNYSSWFENFRRQEEFELAKNKKLQKDIKRLQTAAARTSGWSNRTEASKYRTGVPDRGYIGHKAAKMMKRSKSIEDRQIKAIEEKSSLLQNTETSEALKIQPALYPFDTLVSFNGTAVKYGGAAVCPPVTFQVKRGERVFIDGKNGSGKSSLIKLITDKNLEYTGSIKIGSGLVISYVPQDASELSGNLSDYAVDNKIDESLFKAILRKMDFERIQFEKDINEFSEGQKKKVLIAKSLCEKAHLYIWDEPLNFIDIYSRVQIENLILEFKPTMLLIEHDKAFQEAVATKIIRI